MGLFNNLQRSRGAMRLFIIQLVCCLAWLSTFAFAEFDISEGITGSINFPAEGVTCVANLAVFVTSLIRGRLDLEIGARDVLDFIASPKLKNIEGINDGNGLIAVKEEQTASTGGGSESATNSKSQTEERLDLEIGAQDVPDFIASPKLKNIEGINDGNGPITVKEEQTASTGGGSETGNTSGTVRDASKPNLESADVVMLSNGTPNWSMRQFMKSNALIVDSILLLQFLPYKAAKDDLNVNLEMCSCDRCDCIVFWTMKEISNMLARRMPGTLRRLSDSDSLCLLPCLTCQRNDSCNHGRLDKIEAEETDGLRQTEGDSPVVCGILQDINAGSIRAGEPICICIPMKDARRDQWTKLLLRSFRSKDAEGRGVTVMASEALEGYLAGGRGDEKGTVEYDIVSFIVPRLTEVLINLALTFWFRVDGFSSAVLARRTVRDYLVDSKGNGLAANAFLTKALVKSNASNTQVCQVLTFRGNVLGIRNLSIIVGCVNLMSAIGWAVLIAMEGRADTSPPVLSMPIVLILIGTIGIAFVMDMAPMIIEYFRMAPKRILGINRNKRNFILLIFFLIIFLPLLILSSILPSFLPSILLIIILLMILPLLWRFKVGLFDDTCLKLFILPFTALGLESVFIVSGSAVAGILGIESFGRWLYGVVQILVWVKWAVGSYILDTDISHEFLGRNPHTWKILGILIYSSAFLLNAVLAGVRCKWEPWPWKSII